MSNTPQRWTWPASRAIVLYHWSWFDTKAGGVVAGWSRQSEVDAAGYVHFEEESDRPAETRQIDPESRDFTFAEPHTFTGLTPLPSELRGADGAPLPWIRALLTTK